MASVNQAPRRYFIELVIALALYAAALFVRHGWMYRTDHSDLWLAIMLLPIVPVCLGALAVYRFYRRMDELQRKQVLESLAFSAGVTGVVAIAYGFLEDIGFPHLPIIWVWPVLAACWIVSKFYFVLRENAADRTLGKFARQIAFGLTFIASATATFGLAAQMMGWPHSWPVLMLTASLVFLVYAGFWIFSKKSISC